MTELGLSQDFRGAFTEPRFSNIFLTKTPLTGSKIYCVLTTSPPPTAAASQQLRQTQSSRIGKTGKPGRCLPASSFSSGIIVFKERSHDTYFIHDTLFTTLSSYPLQLYNPELEHSAYLPESILALAEESDRSPAVQDITNEVGEIFLSAQLP